MQMQILLTKEKTPKVNQNVNFLTSSTYDSYDLRDKITSNDKFIVRQGDLIISNYVIDFPRRKGLREVWTNIENGVWTFRNSHTILTTRDSLFVFHPEHGLVIIPRANQWLSYYTIDGAID